MNKKGMVLVALGAVALLATGIVMASNMGFKLNYPLTGPGAPPITGTNSLALPFNQQAGINTASDLAGDITLTGPGSVVQVSRYNKATNGLVSYSTSGTDLTGFTLVPGEHYRIQIAGATVNYIVVGSHDPGLTITLTGVGAPPVTGTNSYAYPYHSIAATAADLAAEINAASAPGNVVQISRYNKATNGLVSYATAGTDLTGFNLTPGEGYRVQVTGNVSFIPAHY